MPRSLRISVRRHFAIKKRRRLANVWPIDEVAATPPSDWAGWPHGKKFALLLTHDVEGHQGLGNCENLMRLETNYGFRSSFNFIPEGCYRTPATLRNTLVQNGFEVGVHDLNHDGKLYSNRESFEKKAQRINHYLEEWDAVGFRSGFMLRNLEWMSALNILYDASTFDTDPFEPQPDGAKSIYPFMCKNSGDGRQFVELPYTLAQDSTLFLLFKEKTIDLWKKKVDWIVKNGGMVLLNLHPDYVQFGSGQNGKLLFPDKLYTELLQYIKSKYSGEYWHPLPKELASWYKSSKKPTEGKSVDTETYPKIAQELSTFQKIDSSKKRFEGKKAAVVLLSKYPNDPRPRRAAEAMVDEGMEVELICIKQTPEEPRRETFNGVNVLRLPMQHKRGGKLAYLFHYFSFILASFFILTFRSFAKRYDIVHVHNMPDVLVFSSLVPKILGAKIILDLHDPMPELMRTIYGMDESSRGVRFLKFCEKISMGFAHSIITVNETCKKIFSNRSCSSGKVTVVMNAVDEKTFSIVAPKVRERSDASKLAIMYHGSLVERNGLGLAVEAISLLNNEIRSKVELRIYGENTEFLQEILKDANSKGIEESIKFIGPKSIEEIVRAIDDCDIGVIPNLKNIFTELNTPTRIFEFLSRGKPVISPLAPGVLEYFSEDSLIMFKLGDAKELASKIEYAYQNWNKLDEIASKGQDTCLKHRWSEERKVLLEVISDQLFEKSADLRIA